MNPEGSSPITGIVCWWPGSIASIPDGWHLCDGTNGTPDYRNVLLIGAGDLYTPGQSLGSLQHLHPLNGPTGLNSIDHNHDVAFPTEGPNEGDFDYSPVGEGYEEYGEHEHELEGATEDQNDDHTHSIPTDTELASILPPCKAGCWIQKL